MPRVTISVPDKTPQPYRFELEREFINIGRGGDNDIIIDNASISTQHCMIERVEGGYILRDNGSTNGIKQEETLMEIIDLHDGMAVIVGDIPLGFELSDDEIQHLSTEEFNPHQKKKLPAIHDQDSPSPGEHSQADVSASRPKPPTVTPNIQPAMDSAQASGLNPIFILIFMGAAVFGGMTIRHYQDHQKFLLSSSPESEQTPETNEDEQITEKPEEP